MERPLGTPTVAFGFLSVAAHDADGTFGGLLVLDRFARPIEFHCTAPVQTNRAQEILYGPTLEPYLYGELIAGSLFDACKKKPAVVLTDTKAVLALRDRCDMPVAWIKGPAEGASPPSGTRAHLRGYELSVPASRSGDMQAIEKLLAELGETVDLAEPFDRIHAAIGEARRAA